MKKTLIAAAVGLALALSASNASAITLTQSGANYVGYYTPPEPANAAAEVSYINALIDIAAGSASVDCPDDSLTCNRQNSGAGNALPDASTANASKSDGPDNTHNLTGYTGYIIGKYQDGPHGVGAVWYLTNFTGEVVLPTEGIGAECATKGCGLSHVSFYGNTVVPDGGTTLGLLGLGMLGLSYLRRRLS